ncbi:metalloprotease, partial [Coemansia sp. BCRC 34301]
MLLLLQFFYVAALSVVTRLLRFGAQTDPQANHQPHLHLDFINDYKPADWQTGFEAKLSVDSALPYSEYTGSIEKSGNDKRQHRLVRLPNNLVALCVQDDDAKESAVSLSVNVGSNANPIELQGLAHFLEHMMHLGTAKYPDEKEYKAFLAKN